MYLQHFGFKEFPFTLTPNTDYFCNLPTYQEALNVLLVSLRNNEGFIKITGEIGTGKTLLCRKLINSLSDEFMVAYIPNPDMDSSSLRKALAKELGISFPYNIDLHHLSNLLTQKLLKRYKEGKKVVIVVDEAQTMSNQGLETLRLLSNLETESEKLLQIVLFGQPELDKRLQDSKLKQLQQRIVFSYHLRPMTREELEIYLKHRLSVTGYTQKHLFSKQAFNLLFKASGGIPRLVNILCHKALMVAYGQDKSRVNIKAMKRAIFDTESIQPNFFKRYPYVWVDALILILLIGFLVEIYLVMLI